MIYLALEILLSGICAGLIVIGYRCAPRVRISVDAAWGN